MNLKSINQDLQTRIRNFKFPKAVNLILRYLQNEYKNESIEKSYKRILFKANKSMAFQKSEVESIYFYEDEYNQIKVELTINFLSLYGASSPLPSNYAEMVLQSEDEDNVLEEFLSIFNHNLQKFVYPIWEKNRYYIQYKKDLSDKFSKYMLSFLGLYAYNNIKSNSLNMQKLIPFIGLLSLKNKSASTLKILLGHYLSYDDIEITQCIKSKYNIPPWQQIKLGDANCSLGSSFLIGDSIVSKNAKFRILFKNASVDDLKNFSVNGSRMDEINELITFAMNEPLEYEICFEIKTQNKTKSTLSKENPTYMGVNFWIGESKSDEQIIMTQKTAV